MRTLVIRLTMPEAPGGAEKTFDGVIEPALRPFGDARLIVVEAPTAEEERELTRLDRRAGTAPGSSHYPDSPAMQRKADELAERNAAAIRRVGDAVEGPPVEPDGYQRHGEDAAEREGLVTIVPARGEEGRSIEMEYDPEARLVQFVKWGEEVFGTLEPIEPEEWAVIGAAFAAPAITPEEARALHAVWAGDAFDAQFLESAQPKLEAIAGESWR